MQGEWELIFQQFHLSRGFMTRFRQIQTFGRDTIRRFSDNVSEMKKLAARDFEDLLQVCCLVYFGYILIYLGQDMIPAIEGLLEEPYNGQLLTLLYCLSEWHALAKLRMHTEHTLDHLDNATTMIGQELRSFRDWTGNAFTCRELPCEINARNRKREKKPKKPGENTKGKTKVTEPKTKLFNLAIYKFHALGDYVQTIRLFGTTDSYSTQTVRLCLGQYILYLLSLQITRENLPIAL
jgi:hypothetical protein